MNEIKHQPERPDAAAIPASPLVDALTSPLLDSIFLRPQRMGVESAWYGHVPFAHWVATVSAPAVLVELGSHYGVSYFAFCEALMRQGVDVRAYAVDTWEGDPHAGLYSDDVFDDVRRFHDGRYRGFSTLLRGRFDEALAHFADGTVDFLHIDGFHTEDAVRADWESWRPKLSDRAIVLFHDTNVRERDFGVWRLWAELRQVHPGFEFLHSHGLGVLAYGRQAPAAVRALCALPGDAAATVRERFALLGERWIESADRQRGLIAQQRAEAALAGKAAELERATEIRKAADAWTAELDARLLEARAEAQRAEELDRYLEATRAELSRVQTEGDQLRRSAANVAKARAALDAELERTRGALAALKGAAQERDRLAAELAAFDAALREERHRHNVLTGSAAWQAAAPLRRIEATFPRASRAAGRLVMAGALAVTGRLPDRLRLRRQVRADAELLRTSPLFDPADYAARYPDVQRSGADPLWHYIWTGAQAGYDPHPLFSSADYLDRHPELRTLHRNPLAHYIQEGAALGHDPHPLFDTAYYVRQEPEAAGRNALLHYVQTGAARSRDPNPFFDTDAYWESHVRDSGSGLEPLSHYVLHGAALGHDPHPVFDTDWYAARHPEAAGENPLAYFLRVGLAAGHAPSLAWAGGAPEPPVLRFAHAPNPDVSIIVPAYGRLFDTLRCLYAVMLHSGDAVRYEVIVADDKPSAPIAPRLRAVPGLHVEQNPSNLGFLRSCNRAAGAAAGRHLVFLNNDTCVHPGWLEPLVRVADGRARVGMVGAKLLNADGTVQEAGGTIHSDGWGEPYGRGQDPTLPAFNFVREVDVVIGACMLVRAEAWREIGGFDDDFAPAYYEEFDLAFALRARGWRVMVQPASRVTHFDAASYGAAARDRQSVLNHARFCRKWEDTVAAQPARGTSAFLWRERPPALGRVLFIDDRVPEPDKHAGSVSALHWLRLLTEAGWNVTFAPHDQDHPEPYTRVLQDMGIEVLYGPTDLPAWLAENGAAIDHVWTARPDVTERLLDAIARFAPGRMIYFTHDLHSLREQRRYELGGDPQLLGEARRLHRIESAIFRQSRLVITPSADELPVIRAMAPRVRARAIPLYSVPAAPIVPADPAGYAARRAVLFVGGYAHAPNVDAALWLAQAIMPLVWQSVPDAPLVLVGSKAPPELLALAGPLIEVPGWLPELDAVYARSRVSLSPLRFGAGVKGKIIEAMEAGVPVVTTPIGNEGLGLQPGMDALIGDSPEALAAHAVALLRDTALCARLADAGRAMLRRTFDEDAARRVLNDVLGIEVCPCCGHRQAAPTPLLACGACGADAVARALAEATIRPWRGLGVTSLVSAAPFLQDRSVVMPGGPLAEAARVGVAAGPLDLLVTTGKTGDGTRIRPGGRWVRPGDAAAAAPFVAEGWAVRLHCAGPDVLELEAPGGPA